MNINQDEIIIILTWATDTDRIFNQDEKKLLLNLIENSDTMKKEIILEKLKNDIK